MRYLEIVAGTFWIRNFWYFRRQDRNWYKM